MSRIHLRRERWAAALLLFAFLPTLTFLGHWDQIFGGSVLAPVSLAASASPIAFSIDALRTDQALHAQHCHTGLGSCSEQPMPGGVGLLLTQEALLGPAPSVVVIPFALESAPALVAGQTPPVPPPRAP